MRRVRPGTIGVFLLAAALAYAPPKPGKGEDSICQNWVKVCNEKGPEEVLCQLIDIITSSSPRPIERGLPVQFEWNSGQADARFEAVAHGQFQNIYLDDGEAVLDLRTPEDIAPVIVRARLMGRAAAPAVEPLEPLPGRVNYFYGNDPSRWITNVASFGRMKYKDVYPGIDVVYYGNAGSLEHDFIVRPGGDPRKIRLGFEGVSNIQIDEHGDAHLLASGRDLVFKKPLLYQRIGPARRQIEGRYRPGPGNSLEFEIGRYDPDQSLVIDPVVSWATFFGRSAADGAGRIAVDAQGNVYTAGFTTDESFPAAPGAPAAGPGTAREGNVMVTKVNAAGTAFVYTTHLGGVNTDAAIDLAVDAQGAIYLTGATGSDDYPVTSGALKGVKTRAGSTTPDKGDCFVTKLSPAGSALSYSTFLGGSLHDVCMGIAVDPQGNAYLAGWTASGNFPANEDAPQRLHRGYLDAFVAKLNPTGSGLVWATLLGGTGYEVATDIAIDASGAAYITGHTLSSVGFPVSAGALQRTYSGGAPQAQVKFGDAFVAKVNPDGKSFGYVTYLGGRGDDAGFSIAVDAQNNAYVAGATNSTNFPVSGQSYQTAFKGAGGNDIYPGGDAFVVKLNPTGSSVVWGTYLGGTLDDWATGLVLDAAGNVTVVGATLSRDFPVSADATQRVYGGSDPGDVFPTGDAFVAQLTSNGAALSFSTYLGGAASDFAAGVARDVSNIYVSGATLSRNFPATPGAPQTGYGGTNSEISPLGDAFVVRFSDNSPPASNISIAGIGSAASYAGNGVAPGEIVILSGSGIGPTALTTLALNGAGDTVSNLVAGTRILFDGVPAPIIYVSSGQSSAIVPYSVAARQSTSVVVEIAGARSAPLSVPVLAAKPALFSANASGRGQGAILNQDNTVNSAANPAAKGSIVVLYGTGEGATNPPGIDGRLANAVFPKPLASTSVTIGGVRADTAYFGAAPNQVAGLFQANVKVPENAPSGNVDVVATVGGQNSQLGLTVAIR